MTELSIYDSMVLLLGEPTNMVGMVLIYILAFFLVILMGCWGLALSILVIKRILR